MKRRTIRRRPEFESLESMVLLSGVAAAGDHAVAALVATKPVTHAAVSLSGTARGTYHSKAGALTTFTAQGTISPLGKATAKGSIQLSTGTGSLTLSTKHGKVLANLSTTGLGAPVFLTITGGTGQYAAASGSAEALVSFSPGRHGNGHLAITFTALVVA